MAPRQGNWFLVSLAQVASLLDVSRSEWNSSLIKVIDLSASDAVPSGKQKDTSGSTKIPEAVTC
jgi:hypothetical protein